MHICVWVCVCVHICVDMCVYMCSYVCRDVYVHMCIHALCVEADSQPWVPSTLFADPGCLTGTDGLGKAVWAEP